MQLLFLDSDHTSLRVFQDVFESWGFDVISCSNGSELLRLLADKPELEAVITELNLPGMARGSLIPLLRKYFPDVPIMVLTANISVQAAINALKSGADEFVPKPFDVQKVRKMLLTSIRKQRQKQKAVESKQEMEQLLEKIKSHMEDLIGQNRNLRIYDLVNRFLFNQISEGLLVLDEKGKVLLINSNLKQLLGLEGGDLIGCDFFAYYPMLRDSALFSLWQEHLKTMENQSYSNINLPVLNSRRNYITDLKIFSMELEENNQNLACVAFLTRPTGGARLFGKKVENSSEVV